MGGDYARCHSVDTTLVANSAKQRQPCCLGTLDLFRLYIYRNRIAKSAELGGNKLLIKTVFATRSLLPQGAKNPANERHRMHNFTVIYNHSIFIYYYWGHRIQDAFNYHRGIIKRAWSSEVVGGRYCLSNRLIYDMRHATM
jgi:hypothetical protein